MWLVQRGGNAKYIKTIALFACASIAALTGILDLAVVALYMIDASRGFTNFLLTLVFAPILIVGVALRLFWAQFVIGAALSCVLVHFGIRSPLAWLLAAALDLVSLLAFPRAPGPAVLPFAIPVAAAAAAIMWRYTRPQQESTKNFYHSINKS